MNGSCSMEPTVRTSAILTHKDSTDVSVVTKKANNDSAQRGDPSLCYNKGQS